MGTGTVDPYAWGTGVPSATNDVCHHLSVIMICNELTDVFREMVRMYGHIPVTLTSIQPAGGCSVKHIDITVEYNKNERLNYEPNTVDWQVGDLVIHDADAKTKQYLMRVIAVEETCRATDSSPVMEYITQSIYPHSIKEKYVKYRVFRNTKEVLHDPKKFGI